jgi:hypothetical protein
VALVCFASLKGAPGVTATTLAVAAAWAPRAPKAGGTDPAAADRRKVLIEADSFGGALATRYQLSADPGLVSLTAAGRSGFDPELIWKHTQELPGGLPMVAAPPAPTQASAALDAGGARLGRHLAGRRDVDALADMGRLYPGSPGLSLAMEASALLILTRPRPEDLQPAAAQLNALRARPAHVGWVLVGGEPYGPTEVERAFGYPVVAVVADDRRSIESFERGAEPRKLRRQPFFRSAAALADTLGRWLAAPSPTDEQPAPAADQQSPPATPDQQVPPGPSGPSAASGAPDQSGEPLGRIDQFPIPQAETNSPPAPIPAGYDLPPPTGRLPEPNWTER